MSSEDSLRCRRRSRRSSNLISISSDKKRKRVESGERKTETAKKVPSEASLIFAEGDSFFNDENLGELLLVEGTTETKTAATNSITEASTIEFTFCESEDMFACSDSESAPSGNNVDSVPAHSTPVTPSRSTRQSTRTPQSRSYSTPKSRGRRTGGKSESITATGSPRLARNVESTPRSSGSRKSVHQTPVNSTVPAGTQATPVLSSYKKDNSQDESQSVSSLPLSVLDVRAQILQETLTPKQSQNLRESITRSEEKFVNKHVVKEHKDRGPFYGLPARVQQLYREQKNIEELFPWQTECLTSKAVQNKENLLYSLPTSGGKTLVAEIIMLQELLCYRKNCIFVLPYVSLVQEKIRSLAPFALDLGFYLEEYAGTRGKFPPQKRRFKKSLFICTIEKAHALLNSLVVEKRLEEVGLVVIDEVHMIGEDSGRGANLESFITKIKYMNRQGQNLEDSLEDDDKENKLQQDLVKPGHRIQIVSMSATVGNLRELSLFLESELYTNPWRPVKLEEFVKVGKDIHVVEVDQVDQFRLVRKLDVDNYTPQMKKHDEDYLTNLIMEVYPEHSCLVFCDTKRRCENVADMLCRVLAARGDAATVLDHNLEDRISLFETLKQEGSGFMCPTLSRTLKFGIAYHHSGLTMDERKLIEEGFLSGAIGVLCCTSTLAAGVNLPARRVIIRSPFMGRNQLSHTQYKQMVGRAGRAGLDTHGESFLMVKPNQVKLVEDVVTSPVEHCITSLHHSANNGLATLVLNTMFLGLVNTPAQARNIMDMTLMNFQAKKLNINMAEALQSSLDLLLNNHLISLADSGGGTQQATQQTCGLNTKIKPSRIGRAAIQGNIQLKLAGKLFDDLKNARPHLAVDTSLHLLYLITPYDLADSIYYTASVYYKIFLGLSESDLQVARFLGITESVVTGLLTGRAITKSLKPVLARFYLSMALLDLWNLAPIHQVADKFCISRGEVQNLMTSAASFASSVLHFCLEIEEFWAYQELLEPFVKRLAHCCSPELLPLLELPGVKSGRARQLVAAGYTSLQNVARADTQDLVSRVEHLSHKAARAMIQSAQLILIEKAEGLHDEADILLDLGSKVS